MINWSSYYKRIPSQIKVGKSIYQILWVDEFYKDHKQLGETRFEGEKQIVIKINQSTKETVLTYWHEVLHAISEEFDAGLTESQVQKLEKSLYFILKSDNLWKKEQKNASNKRKRKNTKRLR